MQKRIIKKDSNKKPVNEQKWLDVERLAQVEITSEEPEQPIEGALLPGAGAGWRAAEPGEQSIRILFNEPQEINNIHLLFEETEKDRTQEFLLSWLPSGQEHYREIVRQQYNFSPAGSSREEEDYTVNLKDAAAIELKIVPEIGGAKDIYASLDRLHFT
jgi:hypothetical protein